MKEIIGEISFEKIILGNIEFKRNYQRQVTKSNKISGKINVSIKFLGQDVIVVVLKKTKEEKKISLIIKNHYHNQYQKLRFVRYLGGKNKLLFSIIPFIPSRDEWY